MTSCEMRRSRTTYKSSRASSMALRSDAISRTRTNVGARKRVLVVLPSISICSLASSTRSRKKIRSSDSVEDHSRRRRDATEDVAALLMLSSESLVPNADSSCIPLVRLVHLTVFSPSHHLHKCSRVVFCRYKKPSLSLPRGRDQRSLQTRHALLNYNRPCSLQSCSSNAKDCIMRADLRSPRFYIVTEASLERNLRISNLLKAFTMTKLSLFALAVLPLTALASVNRTSTNGWGSTPAQRHYINATQAQQVINAGVAYSNKIG